MIRSYEEALYEALLKVCLRGHLRPVWILLRPDSEHPMGRYVQVLS